MADYSNTGAIGRNMKRTEPNHPEYTSVKRNDGTSPVPANITCPCCNTQFSSWISAWVNEAKVGGAKYFALKFTPIAPKESEAPQKPEAPRTAAGDNEIPF